VVDRFRDLGRKLIPASARATAPAFIPTLLSAVGSRSWANWAPRWLVEGAKPTNLPSRSWPLPCLSLSELGQQRWPPDGHDDRVGPKQTTLTVLAAPLSVTPLGLPVHQGRSRFGRWQSSSSWWRSNLAPTEVTTNWESVAPSLSTASTSARKAGSTRMHRIVVVVIRSVYRRLHHITDDPSARAYEVQTRAQPVIIGRHGAGTPSVDPQVPGSSPGRGARKHQGQQVGAC
jgi:hypothetical protein